MEKILHLTDTHLVAPGRCLYGSDPLARLQPVVQVIRDQHADAKALFVTGDLTHWGEEAAYGALKDLVAKIPVPVHLLLGNHDARAPFHAVFPERPRDAQGYTQFVVDLESLVCLALDSLQDGTTPGRLCEDRLAWLEEQLTAHRNRPLFLFVHHPPFDVGIPGMDRLRLLGGVETLRRLLLDHGQVRHLFFGHVHRPIAGSWLGIPISTLFGTNHQVALDLKEPQQVGGTMEPSALGVVLFDAESVIVHMQSFAAEGEHFSLDSPDCEAAQSWNALMAARS
ncbi:MAG: phosphodiesterase [Pseudomonadota bacterium]